jgi:hypothetical protein
MRDYLVCYDYGMGGRWWWITAPSAKAISDIYRDLTVFEKPPTWWNEDMEAVTPRRLLDDPPDAALAGLRR